jgi:hypothetical protein
MALVLAPEEDLRSLIEQGFNAIQMGLDAGNKVVAAFQHMHEVSNQLAWMAFLPLCVGLLVLHENARAATEGTAFRPLFVATRVITMVALLVGYPSLCRLITSVAGWGGHFMTGDQYESLTDWDRSKDALGMAWDSSSLGTFLGIFFLWMVVMSAALFAYIASVLLSTSQGVLLTILLAVGKLCLVASIVPGVSLAKGWARSLAQVAAWSTVGGIIGGLLSAKNDSIRSMMAAGQLSAMFKLAAQFIILAVCTLSTPLIVARIFSGAAPHAVGAMGAMMAGFMGGRLLAGQLLRGSGVAARAASGPGAADGQGGGDGRLHKVPLYQRVLGVPSFRPLEVPERAVRAEEARQARFASLDAQREEADRAPGAGAGLLSLPTLPGESSGRHSGRQELVKTRVEDTVRDLRPGTDAERGETS